ncbi:MULTISPECIES: type II CAAX endopeptidase family protein [unclassified Mucilaginibacter]|uniref:CPBP family intramembrane glutamic endopeptidase n=1 Tax=unclassified Mucilaginibacter TaxID=2617802 RepID=UPI002AC98339|nr:MULTISPECIES: type II CAAX endopeptidase family protein [unclassified Mucilaginibacter]MEB0263731.1 type II CAAX endopeptidase family protein [Mucilaginibacter sp. 10I4]MEB0278007.1 type II CAAX endopeptidase family protein [Mucilaginibacter sp. 10B2]MEB0299640.1 type II CAAX endopeptidase family protein [Mucilaginibacter sp. 5C4]WPX22896.1 type II CAAX endopeptidase family protein [Mucilaginibacter sp. 5C4]
MNALHHPVTNYLIQKTGIKFKPKTLLMFALMAAFAWTINLFGQVTFPSNNLIPFLIRSLIACAALVIVLFTNVRLLKANQLPASSLGLEFSVKSSIGFLLGISIGIIAMVIMSTLMYLFVPYHFTKGPMSVAEVFKTSFSFLIGNTIEELIFRGLPLIVLSQTIGWRKAAFVMALPFGLFHLPGTESVSWGLNIVTTTAFYSMVFSFAFILTGSLWAAISTHVISNVILHLLLGLDGANNALFVPVFDAKWPTDYNLGLVLYVTTSIAVAFYLYIRISKRAKLLHGQPTAHIPN